jgi:leucyl-tRNA synthetase
MEYKPWELEKNWLNYWKKNQIYKVENDTSKPKYYVLDMFPYPSGSGLHVGHPLGYIASDIFSRFKRMKGFNVLHPMGYDAFGLPAEQYAIQTGKHPSETTKHNIARFKEQMEAIGFCYDWSREVTTSDPKYYRWTQWIFMQLFNAWFDKKQNKARHINELIAIFETEGNMNVEAASSIEMTFHTETWKQLSEKERQHILMQYRLAYQGFSDVNWCEELGTVLANDEVVNGVSVRGSFPVVKRPMRQWFLRITAYAQRLLEGLKKVDFPESLKEMQRNWIGRSEGALIKFKVASPQPSPKEKEENASPPNPLSKGEGAQRSPYDYMTSDKSVWNMLKDLSRENRKSQTEAEEILWEKLRNSQAGHKIRRQHAIEGFIADFVCVPKRTIIEIDGDYHGETEQKEYDEMRTRLLSEVGYTVLRFKNDEVKNNTEVVFNSIKKYLDEKNEVRENTPLSFGEGQGVKQNSPSPLERGLGGEAIEVFTTRPDTIFGATFMVLAPEHPLVKQITTLEQEKEIETYITYVKSRSERERQSEVKTVSGAFTGSYAVNPFNNQPVPVWISEYVLMGYGTGAIMAVPADDARDKAFAEKFKLPIVDIIDKSMYKDATIEDKVGKMINSDFLNGMEVNDAIKKIIDLVEEKKIGERKVNYRMRDAGFSRQRYWGEPFPVVYKNGIPYLIDEKELPLELPVLQDFKPTGTGESPLATAKEWVNLPDGSLRETDTMPGYAGSSWYFLRYMDPNNEHAFISKEAQAYWKDVDLYIGGAEHAVGHLLYSRFWHKFFFDMGWVDTDEPYRKLVNQGMIQGRSNFVYKVKGENKFVSYNLKEQYQTDSIHTDVYIVENDILDIEKFKVMYPDYAKAEFIVEDDGKYHCGWEIEKMSKSKYNVVNPDDIIDQYGADTFRMYEMFLGPIEQSKPWNTQGIDGVYKFVKKLWRLFYDDKGILLVNNDEPTQAELKILHKTIKKITEDIERFSFNTCISTFMICVNELKDLNCSKRSILEPLVLLLAPFAPFLTEELWQNMLLKKGSVHNAAFPVCNEKFLVEDNYEYPVSVNGKLRVKINLPVKATQQEIEPTVLSNEIIQKWLDGNPPKKIVFVPGRMVNVVI